MYSSDDTGVTFYTVKVPADAEIKPVSSGKNYHAPEWEIVKGKVEVQSHGNTEPRHYQLGQGERFFGTEYVPGQYQK
jgi:uncharacterized protein (DUF736 family)